MSQDDMALVEPMPPASRFHVRQVQRSSTAAQKRVWCGDQPDVQQQPLVGASLGLQRVPALARHEPEGRTRLHVWGLEPPSHVQQYAFVRNSRERPGDYKGTSPEESVLSKSKTRRSYSIVEHLDSHRPPLRKSKSVKFADSQGLPLVEAVHELTRQDSSYTARKIVPYADEDFLTPVHLLTASQASRSPVQRSCSSSATIAAAETNHKRPQEKWH